MSLRFRQVESSTCTCTAFTCMCTALTAYKGCVLLQMHIQDVTPQQTRSTNYTGSHAGNIMLPQPWKPQQGWKYSTSNCIRRSCLLHFLLNFLQPLNCSICFNCSLTAEFASTAQNSLACFTSVSLRIKCSTG